MKVILNGEPATIIEIQDHKFNDVLVTVTRTSSQAQVIFIVDAKKLIAAIKAVKTK
jgi:hypothetical protein